MNHPALKNAKSQLAMRFYPGPVECAPRLVLLHGWGVHGEIWGDFVTQLQQVAHVYTVDLPGYGDNAEAVEIFQLDDVLEQLAITLPEKAVYIGWSLGGMLAVQFAEQYSDRVQALVCLASAPSFVAREGWPHAMPSDTLASFQNSLNDDSVATLKRFQTLMANGSSNTRTLLSKIRSMMSEREIATVSVLRDSLGLLASLDLREKTDRMKQPILWLLAGNDALIPVQLAQSLERVQQQAVEKVHRKVSLIDEASHLFFITHTSRCVSEIVHFLRDIDLLSQVDSHIAKEAIARSFSKAACHYDQAAVLQRRVGHQLLGALPDLDSVVNPVDLGCGTGYFSEQLSQCFSGQSLIGLDLAEGMLEFARSHYESITCVTGDAEALPLRDAFSSLVFSNLAIQWSDNPAVIFAEVKRILLDEGYFLFSSLAQDSLYELRESWRVVDDYTHVNRFMDFGELRAAIEQSGLDIVSLEVQTETMYYATLRDLTAELKSLGAHNLNHGRPKGLTGRKRMNDFKAAYEKFRDEQYRLPATYQVVLGVLRKAA